MLTVLYLQEVIMGVGSPGPLGDVFHVLHPADGYTAQLESCIGVPCGAVLL